MDYESNLILQNEFIKWDFFFTYIFYIDIIFS